MLLVLHSFVQRRLIAKSRDDRSDLKHKVLWDTYALLVTNCIVAPSNADLPTFPYTNIALALQQEERLPYVLASS